MAPGDSADWNWNSVCGLAEAVPRIYRERVKHVILCNSESHGVSNQCPALGEIFPRLQKATLDYSLNPVVLSSGYALFAPNLPRMRYFRSSAMARETQSTINRLLHMVVSRCPPQQERAFLVEMTVKYGRVSGHFNDERDWPATRRPIECWLLVSAWVTHRIFKTLADSNREPR